MTVRLTSNVAMYYYMLIETNGFTPNIQHELVRYAGTSQSSETKTGIQECWELYVYYQGKKAEEWYQWDINFDQLQLNESIDYSFVREWGNNAPMVDFNFKVMLHIWKQLVLTPKEGRANVFDEYLKVYESYKKVTGKKVYMCFPKDESIRKAQECPHEITHYLDAYTNDNKELYENSVVYEMGDVLHVLKSHRKVPFKSLKGNRIYRGVSYAYELKFEWFVKGFVTFIDLVEGNQRVRRWRYG